MLQDVIHTMTVELRCRNEEEALHAQRQFLSHIPPLIQEVIDEETAGSGWEDMVLKIGRIEIDLGYMLITGIGSAQMLDRFRSAFREELRKAGSRARSAQQTGWGWYRGNDALNGIDGEGAERKPAEPVWESPAASRVVMLLEFLLTGNMPWWVDGRSIPDIGRLFTDVLNTSPGILKAFLERQRYNRAVTQRVYATAGTEVFRRIDRLMVSSGPGIDPEKGAPETGARLLNEEVDVRGFDVRKFDVWKFDVWRFDVRKGVDVRGGSRGDDVSSAGGSQDAGLSRMEGKDGLIADLEGDGTRSFPGDGIIGLPGDKTMGLPGDGIMDLPDDGIMSFPADMYTHLLAAFESSPIGRVWKERRALVERDGQLKKTKWSWLDKMGLGGSWRLPLTRLPSMQLIRLVGELKGYDRPGSAHERDGGAQDMTGGAQDMKDRAQDMKDRAQDVKDRAQDVTDGAQDMARGAQDRPDSVHMTSAGTFSEYPLLPVLRFLGIDRVVRKLGWKEQNRLNGIIDRESIQDKEEEALVRRLLKELSRQELDRLSFLAGLSKSEMKTLLGEPRVQKEGLAEGRAAEEGSVLAEGRFFIQNAGLCLVAAYLPMFFDRLGYIRTGVFQNADAATRAVCLLQYLVTGAAPAAEYQLQLNKLLCGWEMETPLERITAIRKKEKKEADDLLASVIRHWATLKNTSPEGFRASFLQREGLLLAGPRAWTLKVERKTYDLLLGTIGWSFQYIKHPWMKKHIQVEW
jgi:hypothetical protein